MKTWRTDKRVVWLAVASAMLMTQVSMTVADNASSCPTYPPVSTVEGARIYKPGTNSVSDAQGVADNDAKLAPIDIFLAYLGKAVDQDTGATDLSCPYALLRQWAAAGAVLQAFDTPGRVARVWIAPAFGFIVLKFRMRGVRTTPDVAQWLSQLAAAARQDYAKPFRKEPYLGLYSNVYPWSAVPNAISALIGDDAAAMRYQDEAWNNMIAEIGSDGTLQGELGRGARALVYHQLAANGLLVLLDLRRALGRPDNPAQIAKLQRLLDMIGNSLCDSKPLAAAAGAEQEIPGGWGFRVPLAFNDGLVPTTWTSCGPKTMDWFKAEYSGGDARVSAEAVAAAARH